MLIGFITGWILGSVSLYSYLLLTAKETPYPECMDCHKGSCEGCPVLTPEQEWQPRKAA